MAAIRFRPTRTRRRRWPSCARSGCGCVCVSNWDVSLAEVLERCGLADALDGVVTSAAAGARKPDPRDLRGGARAGRLRRGRGAARRRHARRRTSRGAKAAGIRALLIDRDGGGDIESLRDIRHHLDS